MNQNQLLIYNPNFLVFNYTQLELEDIRTALYDSYIIITESDEIPSMDVLMGDELPADKIYNQIVSEIAFDDPDEWEWIVAEECDIFESVYDANHWKVTHDLAEILIMDHIFFLDLENLPSDYPNVKVW